MRIQEFEAIQGHEVSVFSSLSQSEKEREEKKAKRIIMRAVAPEG